MNTKIGGVSLCVAALLLSACATGGSGSSSAGKAPAAAATTTVAGTPGGAAGSSAKSAEGLAASYTLVKKNGTDFYCRKEKVTGSRAKMEDVCLTKAQLDAQAASVDSLLQRMRDTPADKAGMDSSGGRTNNAINGY